MARIRKLRGKGNHKKHRIHKRSSKINKYLSHVY